MSPETRSRVKAQSVAAEDGQHRRGESSSESDTDPDSSEFGDDGSESDNDKPSMIKSPTKLTYLIGHLSETTQSTVRDTFKEPPKIALEKCRRIDDTYAFQMTELVTRSVRIHAPENGTSKLSYQIVKQTLYDNDLRRPLKMNQAGYAEELGEPFNHISRYRLDVLADGLHCHLITPDLEYDNEPDLFRAQEAREILSSVYGVDPDDYRPDICDHSSPGKKKIIKRHDLEQTIFRMLLDNHHFFRYFRSLSRPQDPIKDHFYKLTQRIDRVLGDLDAANPSAGLESPCDVPWAAFHILGCVRRMRHEIYTRDSPLSTREALSAARSLVHVLDSVVCRNRDQDSSRAPRVDRNLYLRLIGDRDQDFVIGVLILIPEAASQFLHNLESILDRIETYGAPAGYVERFRATMGRLRASSTGSGLKRPVQGQMGRRKTRRTG
ncbi:hypothetical protein F66182_8614 [Fusarium sp. NRRL 66182]|nr:hypothetical protein F66182_8614 [Fusarium sp. NRRL 66182]